MRCDFVSDKFSIFFKQFLNRTKRFDIWCRFYLPKTEKTEKKHKNIIVFDKDQSKLIFFSAFFIRLMKMNSISGQRIEYPFLPSQCNKKLYQGLYCEIIWNVIGTSRKKSCKIIACLRLANIVIQTINYLLNHLLLVYVTTFISRLPALVLGNIIFWLPFSINTKSSRFLLSAFFVLCGVVGVAVKMFIFSSIGVKPSWKQKKLFLLMVWFGGGECSINNIDLLVWFVYFFCFIFQ